MPAPHRRFLRPLAVIVVSLGWLGAGGIREDEFQCEEATAHLEECCPDFEATKVSCSFSTGCDNTTTQTAFSIEESRCIQRSSCEAIRDAHICERAAAREPPQTGVDDAGVAFDTTPEEKSVCP